jgi:hypothetical protein
MVPRSPLRDLALRWSGLRPTPHTGRAARVKGFPVDDRVFDGLTKSLVSATHRRVALRRALGGVTLAASAMLVVAPATEGKKKHKKTCPTCPPVPPSPPSPSCPICRSGENFCAGAGTPECGTGCRCLSRLAGGTVCVQFPRGIVCGDCTTDAECSAIVPGAVCADAAGPNCCPGPGGSCMVPCQA